MSKYEVSQQEYWSVVGPMEGLEGHIEGDYPYTIIHRTKSGQHEVGRCVDVIPAGEALTVTHYYLPGVQP